MTQPGETQGLSVSGHLEAILHHSGRHRRHLIDVCVVNRGELGSGALQAYGAKAAKPVFVDVPAIEALGARVISDDLVRLSGTRQQPKIRHDTGAIGAITIELAQSHRVQSQRAKMKKERTK
jgi:hypothetical protein